MRYIFVNFGYQSMFMKRFFSVFIIIFVIKISFCTLLCSQVSCCEDSCPSKKEHCCSSYPLLAQISDESQKFKTLHFIKFFCLKLYHNAFKLPSFPTKNFYLQSILPSPLTFLSSQILLI